MRPPCWPGIVTSPTPAAPSEALPSFRWTDELHQRKGNLLFADGHVERRGNAGWSLANGNQPPEVLLLPTPGATAPTPSPIPRPALPPPEPIATGGSPNPSPRRSSIYVRTQLGVIQVPATALVVTNPIPETTAPAAIISLPEAAEEELTSGFDQGLVQLVQKLISRGYLLILLLLLLLLAVAIWREWKKLQERRSQTQFTRENYENKPNHNASRIFVD